METAAEWVSALHDGTMIDTEYLADKAARLGLLVNIGVPAAIVIVIAVLRQGGLIPGSVDPPAWMPVFFYAMGAVALADLAAGFFLRRFLFRSKRLIAVRDNPVLLEELILRSSLIVFALGAAPIVYGVIVYILGGDVQQLAFFGILTLLGYRFLRPTAGLLQEALEITESQ